MMVSWDPHSLILWSFSISDVEEIGEGGTRRDLVQGEEREMVGMWNNEALTKS